MISLVPSFVDISEDGMDKTKELLPQPFLLHISMVLDPIRSDQLYTFISLSLWNWKKTMIINFNELGTDYSMKMKTDRVVAHSK